MSAASAGQEREDAPIKTLPQEWGGTGREQHAVRDWLAGGFFNALNSRYLDGHRTEDWEERRGVSGTHEWERERGVPQKKRTNAKQAGGAPHCRALVGSGGSDGDAHILELGAGTALFFGTGITLDNVAEFLDAGIFLAEFEKSHAFLVASGR